jgi:predicted ATPase
LTIQGPAGSGKSHLADVLLKEALSSGARIISYQCNSYNAGIPYAGWGGLLHSLTGITSTDPTVLQQEKLHRLLSGLNLPKQVGKSLGMLMGLGFSDQSRESQLRQNEDESNLFEDLVNKKNMRRRARGSNLLAQLEARGSSRTSQTGFYSFGRHSQNEQKQLLQAISNLLTAILVKLPLVIFFEDAHWLDDASRMLLSSLHETLSIQPLFIVLAQRGSENQASVGQTLKLEPLDLSGTNELVADILFSDLTQIIHQQSNGNPLFINEITHWVRQSRRLCKHPISCGIWYLVTWKTCLKVSVRLSELAQ